jgi:hypothetical protein
MFVYWFMSLWVYEFMGGLDSLKGLWVNLTYQLYQPIKPPINL